MLTRVLVAVLLLAAVPADALVFRTITGTIKTATGATGASGTVTFRIVGTVPAASATGIVAPLSTTCAVTTGTLGTCALAAPARYRVTITPTGGDAWAFDATLTDASSAALTLADLYLAGVTATAPAPTWVVSSGVPTGACVTGSIYSRLDGTAGATLYVCEAATWAAK
ncbi:MAG: hypothetical protein PHU75_03900 [Candidatus Nanopelagicales bacterium]|nr:hypothetical protein [Candidatus Nanopelagicales bacterium]